MKIISKLKDYYDWCISKRGVDSLVVYNRFGDTWVPNYHYDPNFARERFRHARFFIAGMVYDLVVDPKEKKILWGQDAFDAFALESLETISVNISEAIAVNDDDVKLFLTRPVTYNRFREICSSAYVLRHCIPACWTDNLVYRENPNEYFSCPVIMTDTPRTNNRLFMDVKLSDWNFGGIVDAETMFDNIYNWLLQRMEKTIVNNQTDKEKIVSYGFDLKSSFRVDGEKKGRKKNR